MLGTPRSRRAETSQESSHWMVIPMAVLALVNVALALTPITFTTLIGPVVSQLMGHPLAISNSQLGLSPISAANRALLVAIVGLGVIILARTQNRARASETWGCGYPASSGRIQYTGRAFSQLFTANILPRSMGPRYTAQIPTNFFPTASRVASEFVDPVTRGVYEPFFKSWANRFVRLRFMQQGILHVYVLYILVTLLFALTWGTIRTLGGFE